MRPRLLVGLALFIVLTTGGAYLWARSSGAAGGFDRRANGIWLDVVWTSEQRDEGEISRLCDDLVAKGFRYAYVYVNSVQASGDPEPSPYRHARRFVSLAKRAQPDLQLIAWIGVLNQARGQGKVPIDDPDVRANLAAFSKELTAEIGFDGVQLNVEPLPNGSEDFLDLLHSVRTAIGEGKTLGIAGHKWAPELVPSVERYSSYWKTTYYRRVGETVDQVAVMTYDSYAPNAEAYRLFQREQTLGVLESVANTGTEVLIGVPTYFEPRPNHNPEAENIESGLRGILDALDRADDDSRSAFAGVALYAHWETDEDEWETYETLWQSD